MAFFREPPEECGNQIPHTHTHTNANSLTRARKVCPFVCALVQRTGAGRAWRREGERTRRRKRRRGRSSRGWARRKMRKSRRTHTHTRICLCVASSFAAAAAADNDDDLQSASPQLSSCKGTGRDASLITSELNRPKEMFQLPARAWARAKPRARTHRVANAEAAQNWYPALASASLQLRDNHIWQRALRRLRGHSIISSSRSCASAPARMLNGSGGGGPHTSDAP